MYELSVECIDELKFGLGSDIWLKTNLEALKKKLEGRKIVKTGIDKEMNGFIKLDDGRTVYLASDELEEY